MMSDVATDEKRLIVGPGLAYPAVCKLKLADVRICQISADMLAVVGGINGGGEGGVHFRLDSEQVVEQD